MKTTSYAENVIALERAHRLGAHEAVFANTRAELCEGTGSNVFVVLDGVVVTPPLRSGCLAGVTRELVLEVSDAVEADVPIELFRAASEAFLTSTTRHVQPILAIDGRVLAGANGPSTQACATAFAELRAAGNEP